MIDCSDYITAIPIIELPASLAHIGANKMSFTDFIKRQTIRAGQKVSGSKLASQDVLRIDQMFANLTAGDPRARPSRYWDELNKLNFAQLMNNGYENFKRTVALNYFTWTNLLPWDSQIIYLCRALPLSRVIRTGFRSLTAKSQNYFGVLDPIKSIAYNFLTLLLWEYVFRLELAPETAMLNEPEEGNPPVVTPRPGMRVSQDLANSLIEFDLIRSHCPEVR